MKSQPVIQNKAWFARARASQKFEFFFDAKDTSSSGGSSQSTTSTNATHHSTRNKKLLGGASIDYCVDHTHRLSRVQIEDHLSLKRPTHDTVFVVCLSFTFFSSSRSVTTCSTTHNQNNDHHTSIVLLEALGSGSIRVDIFVGLLSSAFHGLCPAQ
jgi:hypothetical protein